MKADMPLNKETKNNQANYKNKKIKKTIKRKKEKIISTANALYAPIQAMIVTDLKKYEEEMNLMEQPLPHGKIHLHSTEYSSKSGKYFC